MIKKILSLLLLLVISNCMPKDRVEIHALVETPTIVLGSVKLYMLPVVTVINKKQDKIKEISHTCYSSDTRVYDIPFIRKRAFGLPPKHPEYLRFGRHGLFAVSTSKFKINSLVCGDRVIHGLNIELDKIERGKLNYVGDIKIYIDRPSKTTMLTTQVCSYSGGCSKSHKITTHYNPKKITLRQDMVNNFAKLSNIINISAREHDLIYNKPAQNNQAKVKFSEDVSKIPF